METAVPSSAAEAWASPFPDGVGFAVVRAEEADPATLLPAEQALLGPNAAPGRVRDFALGRAAAHRAMLRQGPAGARLSSEPVLRKGPRMPRWPAGLVGAITHVPGLAAAAVAEARDYHGLGVDLERRRQPGEALLRRILRPEELALLGRAAADWFTPVFSAKECIYKALFPATGVYLGFQDARIDFPPGADMSGGVFDWTLLKESSATFPAGYRGQGRYARQGDHVLTALWIAR